MRVSRCRLSLVHEKVPITAAPKLGSPDPVRMHVPPLPLPRLQRCDLPGVRLDRSLLPLLGQALRPLSSHVPLCVARSVPVFVLVFVLLCG